MRQQKQIAAGRHAERGRSLWGRVLGVPPAFPPVQLVPSAEVRKSLRCRNEISQVRRLSAFHRLFLLLDQLAAVDQAFECDGVAGEARVSRNNEFGEFHAVHSWFKQGHTHTWGRRSYNRVNYNPKVTKSIKW